MNKVCWQINLQKHFGGGEVYTAFLARALRARGWEVHTVTAGDAGFWNRLELGDTERHSARDARQILELLQNQNGPVIHHGAPRADLRDAYQETTFSFRQLSPGEAAAVRPLTLRVVTARPGDTVGRLSGPLPYGRYNDDWFRVLNDLPPGGEPRAGEPIKIVSA